MGQGASTLRRDWGSKALGRAVIAKQEETWDWTHHVEHPAQQVQQQPTEAAGGSTQGTMIEAAVRDALELLEKGAARQRRTVHATCRAREKPTLGAAVAALQNASSVKASRNVLQMCWKSCMLDPSFMSHSTSRQLHDNTAPTARVGAILDVTITRVGPRAGHSRYVRARHAEEAVGGSPEAHTMTLKSLRHTHDCPHGSGATNDRGGSSLPAPIRRVNNPHPEHSGTRFLLLLEWMPPPVEEDTNGTDEENDVDTTTAETFNSSLVLTTTDREKVLVWL